MDAKLAKPESTAPAKTSAEVIAWLESDDQPEAPRVFRDIAFSSVPANDVERGQ